jgi:hypothetical protein
VALVVGTMTAGDVWDVLVTNANARQDGLAEFLHHWPQCREFRFMGSLGFGGKVYVDPRRGARVDCCPEDETPERRATIERTNAALAKLNEKQT